MAHQLCKLHLELQLTLLSVCLQHILSHLRRLSHIHRASQIFIWFKHQKYWILPFHSVFAKIQVGLCCCSPKHRLKTEETEEKDSNLPSPQTGTIYLFFSNTLEYVIPLCSLSMKAYSLTGTFSSTRINKFITDQSSWEHHETMSKFC